MMKLPNTEGEKRKRFYTVKEASEILGFSTNTIYKYLDEGSIKGRRLGGRGRFKIPYSELAPYLSHEDSVKSPVAPQVETKVVGGGSGYFEALSKVMVGLGIVYIVLSLSSLVISFSPGVKGAKSEKSSPLTDITTSIWGYSERTFTGFGNLSTKFATAMASKFRPNTSENNLATENLPDKKEESPKEEVGAGPRQSAAKSILLKVPDGSQVNVREEATTSSKVIAKVQASETVNKISKEGDWTKISIRGLLEGWVNNQFLEEDIGLAAPETQVLGKSSELKGKKVVINETPTGWLRVRNTPNGDEIGRVYPGESFVILDEIGGWFLIEISEGKEGWISSEFATPESAD